QEASQNELFELAGRSVARRGMQPLLIIPRSRPCSLSSSADDVDPVPSPPRPSLLDRRDTGIAQRTGSYAQRAPGGAIGAGSRGRSRACAAIVLQIRLLPLPPHVEDRCAWAGLYQWSG